MKLFLDDKASPLWLARRRIVVCSLIFEAVLVTVIVAWAMVTNGENSLLDTALINLLWIFGATVSGYVGIATWGDKNDMQRNRNDRSDP